MPLPWLQCSRAPIFRLVRFHHWPSVPHPTPYQIFGLNPLEKPEAKRVRQIYFELVKIYHPDRGGDSERFKRIVEANKVLNDHSKGINTAWKSDGSASKPASSQKAHYYHPQTHNFDDYDYGYWSNQNQQQFDESLRANRIWVLKLVVSFTVIVAFLNMVVLKKMSTTRNEMLNRETERVASMLAQSLADPREDDPESRIARFLAHRQRTLDRFGEFSYDSITRGVKRREKVEEVPKNNGKTDDIVRGSDTVTSNDSIDASHDEVRNDTNYSEADDESTPNEDTPDESTSKQRRASPPPTKRNSGRVAEYFGRT